MSKQTPSEKSTPYKPMFEFTQEQWDKARAKIEAEEIEQGKRMRDKNGNPVIVVDVPIDL